MAGRLTCLIDPTAEFARVLFDLITPPRTSAAALGFCSTLLGFCFGHANLHSGDATNCSPLLHSWRLEIGCSVAVAVSRLSCTAGHLHWLWLVTAMAMFALGALRCCCLGRAVRCARTGDVYAFTDAETEQAPSTEVKTAIGSLRTEQVKDPTTALEETSGRPERAAKTKARTLYKNNGAKAVGLPKPSQAAAKVTNAKDDAPRKK